MPQNLTDKRRSKNKAKLARRLRTNQDPSKLKQLPIPEGSPEEMQEALDKIRTYQLNLLHFADKEPEIAEEEIAEQRRLFYFAKMGPRAGYFLVNKHAKLTSPDVIFILTCNTGASKLAGMFKVNRRLIHEIRTGKAPEWRYEYQLIRRIKALLRSTARLEVGSTGHIWGLFKDNKLLILAQSERKIELLREGFVEKLEEEDRVLDLYSDPELLQKYYPIKKLEVHK